ncbi:ankyrin [Neocallimastix lanati (nom. inval.)]|uniref:Ankyrin n=1 Tax=Neocallimastix californiae TaxID=1754190 RepID=A0A1Y2B8Z5_9FUNG|nr:ankyrin [Neocallimastix sp. JGI-2020a]ORY31331.1 ankyrin [Neocallimastix californiae]|eukprot:ORY31331.1 ankyrin [Neocallimastix californiae]
MDYATENKIILKLNENNYRYTLIFVAMQNNNIEMFELLVKYSIEKGIKLIIDENDIEKMISENKKYSSCKLKSISEINSKFFKLICFCKNKNLIKVIFSRNSYFLKRFKEINENKRKGNESKDYDVLEIENKIKKIELEKEKKEKEKIRKENEIKKIELEEEKKEKEKKEKEKIRKENELMKIELEEDKKEKEKIRKENELMKIELEEDKKEKEKIRKENELMKIELEEDKKEKEKIRKENELMKIELEKQRKIKEEKEYKKLEKKNYIMEKYNNKRDNNETILTSECKQGNIEEVKKLIHYGMNINEKNKDGDTPLLIAFKNGNVELVKYLFSYKLVKEKVIIS